MNSIMDTLRQTIETETKRKTVALKGHTFKIVCNSLTRLLDDVNIV